MTSRTEAIALRLWKLKAASMDLDMIKKYTTPTSPQLSPSHHTTTQSQSTMLLSSPYHHHQHHHQQQHRSRQHESCQHLPPSLISSDEDDRHSLCSSLNSNTSSPLDDNAPQNSFVESTTKYTADSNRQTNEHNNNNNDKNEITLPSPTTSQSTVSPATTQIKKNEDLKPTQSYIALIATAILKSKDKRLVLSDIYKHILDNYSYFQSQDKSWRNSIRHNLSLNECFIKVGRSEQGKGHYWAIHPANYDDFSQGDFRRRRARRRVRRSFMDHHHPYTGYPLRPYANLSSTRRPSLPSQNRVYRADSYIGTLQSNPMTAGSKYQHLAESFLIRSGEGARHDYEESKRRISILSSPKSLRRDSRGCTTDFFVAVEASKFKAIDHHQYDQRMRTSPTLTSSVMNRKNSSMPAYTVPDQRTSSKAAAFSIDSLLGNNNNNNKKDQEYEDASVTLNILKRKDRRNGSEDKESCENFIIGNRNKDSIRKLKLGNEDRLITHHRQHSYKFPFYFQ